MKEKNMISKNQNKNNPNKDISMNEELQEWLKEAKSSQKIIKKQSKTSKKTPSGKCQICGQKYAKFVCLKCNKSVCASCFFNVIGVCKKCVPKDTVEKWEKKHPDWEKVLGVEWVD